MSLPISSFQLSLAKLLALFLENTVVTIFVMAPSVFICFMEISPPWFYLPIMLIGILLIPFLSTAFCLLTGFLLSLFQSRVRHSALVTNLLYLLFLGSFIWLNSYFNRLLNGEIIQSVDLRGTFARYLAPFYWLRNAAINGNMIDFLKFFLSMTLPFLLIVWIFSRYYKRIFSSLSSQQVRRNFHLGTMRTQRPLNALLKKELKRYFGTTIYFINTGFTLIALLGLSLYLLFKPDTLLLVSGTIYIPPWTLFLGLLCVSALAGQTTNVSLSLEGDQLWILKESPLKTSTIFLAKILTQFFVMILFSLPALLLFLLRFPAPPESLPGLFILPLLCSFFSAQLGLVINLFFPKLDGANDTTIVKQSLSAIIGIFSTMFLACLLGFGFYQFSKAGLSFIQNSLISGVLLLFLNLLLHFFLKNRGEKLFRKL